MRELPDSDSLRQLLGRFMLIVRAASRLVLVISVLVAGVNAPALGSTLERATAVTAVPGALMTDEVEVPAEGPEAKLPAPDLATDGIAQLPNEVGKLPEESTSTVDAQDTWTKVPDAPVKVREDPDFVDPSPAAAVPDQPSTEGGTAAVAAVWTGGTGVATAGAWNAESTAAVDESSAVDVSVTPLEDLSSGVMLISLSDATPDGVPSPDPSPSPTSPTPSPMDPSPSPMDPSPSPVDPSPSDASPSPDPLADGSITEDLDVPLEVKVSYGAYDQLFGGGWADRLQITAFPECYATTPEVPECSEGLVLPVVNNSATKTITFSTADVSEADSATVGNANPASFRTSPAAAIVAGTGNAVYLVSAESGNYGATKPALSGSWQAGEGSGQFSYNFPIAMPPSLAGNAPSLGLFYSSGTVDGMSLAENGQASSAGLGWNLDFGFVSRAYAACSDDGLPARGDLCWKSIQGDLVEREFITLNGKTSRLINVPGTQQYRLSNDPGWKVTRVKNESPGASDPNNTDNNNEAWKVSTPDGTTYWFGWGHSSGGVWTVPVFGNNLNEPCFDATTANAWCQQAWRWNLDRVVDASGNETRFYYESETNYYGRWANSANQTPYDRGGRLTEIKYGYPDSGADSRARVVVNSVLRCNPKLTDINADCSGSNGPRARSEWWPDTPGDLICDATGACDNFSPSFFTNYRYQKIVTKVRSGNSEANVDVYTLVHTMPDPDGSGKDEPDLWLSRIEHVGEAGGSLPLPSTYFSGVSLQNRVVVDTGERTLKKFRLSYVRNPMGGLVQVTYGHESGMACDRAYVTGRARWASNRECWAQKYAPPGKTPAWEWFHKYVVKKVALGDYALRYDQDNPAGASNFGTLRTTRYTYLGDPGWRYSEDKNVDFSDESWDDWRGYGRVDVEQLKAGGGVWSRKHSTFYRGLDGARKDDGTEKISEHIWTIRNDQNNEPADTGYLQGQLAESVLYASDGTKIQQDYTEYAGYLSVSNPDTIDARLVVPVMTESTTPGTSTGKKTSYFTYDVSGAAGSRPVNFGALLQVDTQDKFGGSVIDSSCTKSDWLAGSSVWIRAPRQQRTWGAACASAAGSNLESQVVTHYDSQEPSTLGATSATAALTKGLPTAVDTAVKLAAGSSKWIRVKSTYDTYGRLESSIDGKSKTYALTRSNGDEIVATTTAVGPDGHVLSSTTVNRRGQPVQVTDANGQTTQVAYDPAGRLISVVKPGNTSTVHDLDVTYVDTQLTATQSPSYVITKTKVSATKQMESREYFDGWARSVLRVAPALNAPTTQRTDAATFYDDRGLVEADVPAFSRSAQGVSAGALSFDPMGTPLPTHTNYTYDAAGRPVTVARQEANPDGTAVDAVTTSTYDGRVTTTNLPSPLGETKTTVDGSGRTVALVATGPTADGSRTNNATYSYDVAGNLTSIISNSQNWSFDYDLAGRRIKSTDPDVGVTTYLYDDNSNTIETQAAGRDKVSTSYDDMNRPLQRLDGTTIVAAWTYGNGPVTGNNDYGRLLTETSQGPSGEFKRTVNGYTASGLPKSTTLTPPAALNLAPMTQTFTYDAVDHPVKVAYSEVKSGAVSLLPATEQTGQYATDTGALQGSSVAVGGAASANMTVGYDAANRLAAFTTLPADITNDQTMQRSFSYSAKSGRPIGVSVATGLKPGDVNFPTVTNSYSYDYDLAGFPNRITSTNTDGVGATSRAAWCYTYDGLGHLATATTGGAPTASTIGSVECPTDGAAAPENTLLGGRFLYNYKFDATRLTEVKLSSPGGTTGGTVSYQYSSATPHQLVSTSSTNPSADYLPPVVSALVYSPDGRVESMNDGAATVASEFDNQGNLTKTTQTAAAGQTVSKFDYDPAGMRLAAKTTTPNGTATTTVFLGSTEITITKPSGQAAQYTARRMFSDPSGAPAAWQTQSGWTWLATDLQGSVRLSLNTATAGTAGAPARHNYLPYGEQVGTAAPQKRGYLGKPLDGTGEIRLDHRNFKAELGVFTTPDPVLAPYDLESLNPYAYANGNPIAGSDPTGLFWEWIKSVVNYASSVASGTVESQTSLSGVRDSWAGSAHAVAQTVDASINLTPGPRALQALGLAPAANTTGVVDKAARSLGADLDSDAAVSGGFRANIAMLAAGGEGSGAAKAASKLPKLLSKLSGWGDDAANAAASTSRYTRTTFGGNRVYQRNDLIDPSAVDKLGRSNLERMQAGIAPLGPDGRSINLHHLTQRPNGAIAEVTATMHQTNSRVLHINPNTIPSGIDRGAFDAWRRSYWMSRAGDF